MTIAVSPAYYNYGQTFFVDPASVQNATKVGISAVNLYFRYQPVRNNNLSGAELPGVTVYLVETIFGVPNLTGKNRTPPMARVERSGIQTSSDATIATTFRFKPAASVETGKMYAIMVRFDGASEYELWKSKQGEKLVGTSTISPGASGNFAGNFYESILIGGDILNYNDLTDASAIDEYTSKWRPMNDTDLKFEIFVARYSHGGYPVGSNTGISVGTTVTRSYRANTITSSNGSLEVPGQKREYVTFDENLSTKEAFVGGQYAYQNTIPWPGGKTYATINCTSNSVFVTGNTSFPNGQPFNWNTVFNNYSGEKFLVVKDTSKVNVRRVSSIVSNTVLAFDEPLSITNAAANFLLTPVAKIDGFNRDAPYGVMESIMLLTDSTANSSVRFVNNAIGSVSITGAGSSYSNSDIMYVNGFESITGVVEGGYKAIANLTTNSSGAITAVSFSNLGCGFVNTSAMSVVIANSSSGNTTSNTSAGSSATFSFDVGSTIKTEFRTNNFRKTKIINLPLSEVIPFFEVDAPAGVTYDLSLQTQYYTVSWANALSNAAYFINPSVANSTFALKMFQKSRTQTDNVPVIMSRSNEFNTMYANGSAGSIANSATPSEVLTLILDHTSNNDFVTAGVTSRPRLALSKYIINNDYTNEHTDRGNALAKGISKKVRFSRMAEDLLVYLTAYRPANTDLVVYARLHNSTDTEAFDDKNWTKLELIDGIGAYSSDVDRTNMVELTYGIPQYPNTQFTLAGSVTTQSGNSQIVGVGTTISSNLAANDVVKIYSPLFPNNHMIAVVNSVTNATHMVITQPVSNVNVVGSGFKIDKIEFPQQAFRTILNENVVRYFNSTRSAFDGYNTVQIKTVFTSPAPNKVPMVDDIKIVGTSA